MSETATLRLGLVGASGRMGRRLLDLVHGLDDVAITAVAQHRTPPVLPAGCTARVSADLDEVAAAADVVVDFSAPAAIDRALPACLRHRRPYLLASTGLAERQQQTLRAAADELPVLVAANLSVGISVLAGLVREACARLPEFDVEVVEAHHRHKRDAPSGTALLLYEQAASVRSGLVPAAGRSGAQAERMPNEVGLHAVRGGDVAGEHHVLLLGDGERIELGHRSHGSGRFAASQRRPSGFCAGRT
jgi:4-hydroxy-tetrahydrodipicolinate reductase